MKRYIPYHDWLAQGRELFGENMLDWVYVCPICERRIRGGEFLLAGLKSMGMYCPYTLRKRGKDFLCEYGPSSVTMPNPVIVEFEDQDQMHMFEFHWEDEGARKAVYANGVKSIREEKR